MLIPRLPNNELLMAFDQPNADIVRVYEDDESIQCCVDISCGAGTNGANQCRNNAEDNPCEIGSYKSGVRFVLAPNR